MRLQMTLCALLTARVAHAERVATWLSVYSDDDDLTVVSPHIAASGDAGALGLRAAYDVDIISAASIDVVSAASPRGYKEERHGLALGADYRWKNQKTLALAYQPSWEPDYVSHGLSATASGEFVQRRLALALSYRVNFNRVGRSGDAMTLWDDLTEHAFGGSLGWVADSRTVFDVQAELQTRTGQLASPYRYVPIESLGTSVREAVPRRRTGAALRVGIRRALTGKLFASLSYRFYGDDWRVFAHTGDADLQRSLRGQRWIVGTGLRASYQDAAAFYRSSYDLIDGDLPALRAIDKALARNASVLAHLRGEWRRPDTGPFSLITATAKLAIYHQTFWEFPRLGARNALIVSFGASAEF